MSIYRSPLIVSLLSASELRNAVAAAEARAAERAARPVFLRRLVAPRKRPLPTDTQVLLGW